MITTITKEISGKNVDFNIDNGRMISFCKKNFILERDYMNDSWEIYNRSFSIKKDDNIEFTYNNTLNYRALKVIETHKEFLIFSHERTKASVMLVPLLNKSQDELMFNKYFVNAYLDKKNVEVMHLMYRNFENEEYLNFILKQKNKKVNGDFTTIKVKLPRLSEGLLYNFLNGKYSCFDDEYKCKILSFHECDENSKIFDILYKTKKGKQKLEMELNHNLDEDAELWDIPDINVEILNKS